jgi:hypothetical protein
MSMFDSNSNGVQFKEFLPSGDVTDGLVAVAGAVIFASVGSEMTAEDIEVSAGAMFSSSVCFSSTVSA